MSKSILLVLTNPMSAETEAEFNHWYNTFHAPEVLSQPGFISAKRFKLAATLQPGGTPSHRYAAIYEVEDVASASATLLAAMPKFTKSTTMDLGGAVGGYFEEILSL